MSNQQGPEFEPFSQEPFSQTNYNTAVINWIRTTDTYYIPEIVSLIQIYIEPIEETEANRAFDQFIDVAQSLYRAEIYCNLLITENILLPEFDIPWNHWNSYEIYRSSTWEQLEGFRLILLGRFDCFEDYIGYPEFLALTDYHSDYYYEENHSDEEYEF